MSSIPTNAETSTATSPQQAAASGATPPAAPKPPARTTPSNNQALRPKPPVSVVILTLNEEINVRAAIDSCDWCDDVHVLDSGSTDRTQEIARELGAKVHYHAFSSFGDQRNWAIDHIPTKHPWIFHLDADERFTTKLVDAMADRLNGSPDEAGYHVPSKTMFMGRWLKRAAGYPTYQMRLFHKERMRFIDYGHGQREDENADIGVINVPYLHFSFSKGIYDWLDKHNRYSTLEALQVIQGKEYDWKVSDLFFGKKIHRWRAWKELTYHLPMRAKLRWFAILFVNGGILEGRAALTYANLMVIYEKMITAKLRVLRSQIEMGNESLPPSLREPSQQFEPLDTPHARVKATHTQKHNVRANPKNPIASKATDKPPSYDASDLTDQSLSGHQPQHYPTKLPITVCIPVRNEEKNLPHCLRALGENFKEIVIIDSSSTDATQEIAKKAKVQVVNFVWNGQYPKKRNWLLQNHEFKTPWVLFLDADERLTPNFIEELHQTLPNTPHVGFWLSYKNWFMHRPLLRGDSFSKLALFKIGAGEYERFHEDIAINLDMEVHEHPILEGTTAAIESKIEHHEYRGYHHYIAKHNSYSSWEAERHRWLQQAEPDAWEQFTKRQRFKYKYLDRWWFGCFYFIVSYFIKLGFLDGSVGWTFNRLKWRYFTDIRLKIHEKRNP